MQDTLGRSLSNLRLSVTDRCNLRCAYCMPEEDYAWLPSADILTFEELSALVDRFIAVGVRRVRITGGEPLVRRELPALISMLAAKPLDDLALTTNGVLLADHASALKAAKLRRLTISLDTLQRDRFIKLTRRDRLAEVKEGIRSARAAGFEQLKLDTVVIRGVNDDELGALLDFAREHDAELRFIEYMDVGGATRWSMKDVVSAAELEARFAPLSPLGERGSAPAERFRRENGQIFGIIGSTTRPFCSACDRARLTADGQWFSCLYATRGVDLKQPLRAGATAAELERAISETWSRRADRGAEQRAALRADTRGPLFSSPELKGKPHLEMHTRGG